MPGIQKMFEAGEVQFTSLHNFCPLPVEIMHASPDCYKFSAAYSKERERAIKQTFQTIDFAERLGAPFVVLHCGEIEMNPITDELIVLAKRGEIFSREYVRMKLKAVQTREAAAPPYLERVKDSLKRIAEYAAKKNIRLGVEGRRGYEEIPSERELPALLDELNSPAARLLARHGAHPDQGKPRLPEPRGMAAPDRPARLRLPSAGLHLAGAGSPTAFRRNGRSGETCSAPPAELLICLGDEPTQNVRGNPPLRLNLEGTLRRMKKMLLTILQLAVTGALLYWVFHDPAVRAAMVEAIRHARTTGGLRLRFSPTSGGSRGRLCGGTSF